MSDLRRTTEAPQMLTAGGETFIHPSALTRSARLANSADLHARFARAFEAVGDGANAKAARRAERIVRAKANR